MQAHRSAYGGGTGVGGWGATKREPRRSGDPIHVVSFLSKDNEPLMRALAKLVAINSPDLVWFQELQIQPCQSIESIGNLMELPKRFPHLKGSFCW